MNQLGLTETRKRLSQIITEEESVEVSNPYGRSIIIPKGKWEATQAQIVKLEKELTLREMDLVMARQEPKLSSEEVEKLLFI